MGAYFLVKANLELKTVIIYSIEEKDFKGVMHVSTTKPRINEEDLSWFLD